MLSFYAPGEATTGTRAAIAHTAHCVLVTIAARSNITISLPVAF
jgi:hypothetical protein